MNYSLASKYLVIMLHIIIAQLSIGTLINLITPSILLITPFTKYIPDNS